jgi:hypothetical protein
LLKLGAHFFSVLLLTYVQYHMKTCGFWSNLLIKLGFTLYTCMDVLFKLQIFELVSAFNYNKLIVFNSIFFFFFNPFVI